MKFALKLDVILWLIIGAGLSLLYVPKGLLMSLHLMFWLVGSGALAVLIAYAFTYYNTAKCLIYGVIFVLSLGYFHFQANQLLSQAEQLARVNNHISTPIKIEKILHQQDYQTIIATARLAEKLPEQRIYLQWQSKNNTVSDRKIEAVKVGQIWQAELLLKPLSSRLNQGGFERQKWYFSQGISAYGRVKSAVKIAENFSWRERLLQVSFQQTQGLSMQGLLLALGFGERAWLNPEHWQIYQKTNTAHLIAISGLHIGLAMLLGFALARVMQFFLPTHRIGAIWPLLCGIFIALIYAQLAGFSIPTLRALLALCLVCVIRMLRCYYTAWQYFQWVVALLMLWDPLMLLSVSFWLSAGAVASLILWYQLVPLDCIKWQIYPIKNTWVKKLVRWIFSLFHLQLGLLCLFTPIQLYFFHGMALSGMIANLFAVPLFSLCLVPMVLFAVLSQGALGSWQGANWLAEYLTEYLAQWQGYWLNISHKQGQWIVILLLGLGLLYVHFLQYFQQNSQLKVMKKPILAVKKSISLNAEKLPNPRFLQKMKFIFIGLLSIMLINLGWQGINTPKWRLETLDVGQGLATLLVKNQRGILYDTGAAWRNGSMAELEILPYLQRQGIVLDKLVLSHDDNDHSGGAEAILQAFPQIELMASSRKNVSKKHRTFCLQGKQWQWQGLTITALSPQQIRDRAENPDSCVLLIDDGQYKVLLTGDADSQTERQFADLAGKIEVLQVGHHGSKTSSSEYFIKTVQPKIALISSSRGNPWHFPHSVVLERLKAQQSAVYNTADFGQISLLFFPEQIKIHTVRSEFSPWYRGLIGLLAK
ncbi:DNA internalization-related competence protein ComEC/Rec2 [Avibacterium sp. 21-599]|uniref:DNA internalization-related competence protein ComEC/Rec2 n=1 Tax=Avibacterium sp. 21-599 TaxID=2911528 RepID=UPI002246F5D1|nr:DNA internalization-related competence protein ComEC/Rec2 [Avibacterium sp. 21-599]MCW9718501.1 DNA internalization-related competence protein ComEC/Rec2 [Avibacterium sp. 21-599]